MKTQTIVEFLTAEGYGFARQDDGTIRLTGEWISEWPSIVFDADAAIEEIPNTDANRGETTYTTEDGETLYSISDGTDTYRLTTNTGSGASGEVWEFCPLAEV